MKLLSIKQFHKISFRFFDGYRLVNDRIYSDHFSIFLLIIVGQRPINSGLVKGEEKGISSGLEGSKIWKNVNF